MINLPYIHNDFTFYDWFRDSKSRLYYSYKCICGEKGRVRSDQMKQNKGVCNHFLPGMKFGRLTVVGLDTKRTKLDARNSTFVYCDCECGTKNVSVLGRHLKTGHTKSCGCINKEQITQLGLNSKIDITGEKFGRWTVLYEDKNTYGCWVCRCECGTIKSVSGNSLRRGDSKSCGCYLEDIRPTLRKKYNTYEQIEDYYKIYTENFDSYNRNYFYVDKEDFEKIKDTFWSFNMNDYLCSNDKDNNHILLHRVIMNLTDKNLFIDHIHGSKTKNDNRKSNLRIATPQQNAMNKALVEKNTSGYTGVHFDKTSQSWVASIGYMNKHYWLGGYKNKEDAIKRRKEAEQELYGEWSYDYSQSINTKRDKHNEV